MSRPNSLSGLAIAVVGIFVVVLLSIPASAAKGPVQKGKGGGGKDKGGNPVMDADFRDDSSDRIVSDNGTTYLTGEMFGTGNFGLHLEDTEIRTLTMDFMAKAGDNNTALPFVLAMEPVFFRSTKVTLEEDDICVEPTLPCIPIGESRRSTLRISWTDETTSINYRLRFNDDLGGDLVLVRRIKIDTWEIEAGSDERARVTSTGPKVKGKRQENDYGLFYMPFLVTVTCENEPPNPSVGLPCQ